jgi:hypothetical protein
LELYRARTLTSAVRELARNKLQLVDVQEIRRDNESTVRAGDYNIFLWKRNEKHIFGRGFLVHHRVVPAVKTEDFVRDKISYIVPRGRWCNNIFMNVHASGKENIDHLKNIFMRN